MKTLKIIILLCTSLTFSQFATASDEKQPASEAQTINVKVNGLVCDFCSRSIEKVFNAQDSIEKVTVSLDDSTVKITLKANKTLSNEAIKKLVDDSGYDVAEINRKS